MEDENGQCVEDEQGQDDSADGPHSYMCPETSNLHPKIFSKFLENAHTYKKANKSTCGPFVGTSRV